jgi:hypothetical protein
LSQTVTHQIVAYDPTTEKLVFEIEIPLSSWESVKSIIAEDNGDPDFLYVHRIDYGKAADILGIVHASGQRGLDYYIECSAS